MSEYYVSKIHERQVRPEVIRVIRVIRVRPRKHINAHQRLGSSHELEHVSENKDQSMAYLE